jgi:hypothetical protein
MCLRNQPQLLRCEMIKTESLQVFQCFEQLELLVSVRGDSRVSGQQIRKWTERPALTPDIDQVVKRFEKV